MLKQFRRNYSDPNRGPTGKGVAKYRALKHTCQACPSKPKCCSKAECRKVTREEHDDARDVARAIRKTAQYKISSKLRKKSRCSSPTSNAFLGWGGSDYGGLAAQTTNSSSLQPPRTCANWPKSFPHRGKREKPDQKGGRTQFSAPLSAPVTSKRLPVGDDDCVEGGLTVQGVDDIRFEKEPLPLDGQDNAFSFFDGVANCLLC